jgi:AI-2 transport system ATP-binding protein
MEKMNKSDAENLLQVCDIYKSFGDNMVLKGMSLTLTAGEVLALIGGNGAGKSTLMKIIMGIYTHDSGQVIVDGKEMAAGKTTEALSSGVYMVPQEPLLFPNMTVEENILIGFNKPQSELHKELVDTMKKIGWNLELGRKANTLSIAEQQLVELLRGLLRHAKILILDEPTSALTFKEVESLFKVVKDLKEQGIGIIYITHRLEEVFEIATNVGIMRDGRITLMGKVEEFTKATLVKGLLPDATEEREEVKKTTVDYSKPPVLELKNFSGYGFSDISLKVYPGEILGVAGVVGAGRTEMAQTIFGMDKVLGGKVYLDGKDITGLSTRKVMKAGVNYVSEDRHADGLFKISSVAYNMTSGVLNDSFMGKLFLDRKKEKNLTQQYIDDFRIKVTGQDQELGSLSGGNQQKVVIGHALATNPKLIILDEPTRGIDAGARTDVYNIIKGLSQKGLAVLLISSDMEEVIELSDRAVIIYQGKLNCEFERAEINQENLTRASFGVNGKERES